MISSKTRAFVFSILVFVLAVAATLPAVAETLVVAKTGAQFSSIQAAIDAAGPGDIVLVKKGTYRENLRINKALTLRGEKKSKVKIKGALKGYPVMRVGPFSEKVTIESISLLKAKRGGCKNTNKCLCPHGLGLVGRAQVTITHVKIAHNSKRGIYLSNSSQVTVRGSEITDNSADGIHLSDSSQATVRSSEITGNYYGIFSDDSSQVTVRGSEITESYWGITLQDTSQAIIQSSEITESYNDGITLSDSSQATVRSSEITGNEVGINISGDSVIEGVGNFIYENDEANLDPSYQYDVWPEDFYQPIPPPSKKPQAEFDIPFEVRLGKKFTLDASHSTYLNGEITDYKWDFDGDNNFDTSTANPVITHSYQDTGKYTVTLKVTGDSGATSTKKSIIIVRPTWAQTYRRHKHNSAVFLDRPEIEHSIQYWKKTYDILRGSKVAAHLTEGAIDFWKIWVNLSLAKNPSFDSIAGAITDTVQGVTSINGVSGEYAQTLREVSHLSQFAFKSVDNLEKLDDVQRFATRVASTAKSTGSLRQSVKSAVQSSDVAELKGLGSIAATKTIDVLTEADLNLFQQVSFSEMIHIGADLMVLRKLSDTLQNLKEDPTKEEVLRYYSLLRIHYKLRQTSLAIYASYRQKIEEKDWWEAPLTQLTEHIHEALGTEISSSEELQDLAKFYSRMADKTVLELGKIASSAAKRYEKY